MDGDLQDPPEVIPQLIAQWQAGNQIVFAVRASRSGEGLFKRITAPVDAGDFRLMSRVAVEALKPIREQTKYPLTKMIRFALNGIFSFSFLPLQLATYLGLGVSLISFIYLAYAVWLKLFTTRVVQGWASVIVAVLFTGGVQLLSLGIIGEYIDGAPLQSLTAHRYPQAESSL